MKIFTCPNCKTKFDLADAQELIKKEPSECRQFNSRKLATNCPECGTSLRFKGVFLSYFIVAVAFVLAWVFHNNEYINKDVMAIASCLIIVMVMLGCATYVVKPTVNHILDHAEAPSLFNGHIKNKSSICKLIWLPNILSFFPILLLLTGIFKVPLFYYLAVVFFFPFIFLPLYAYLFYKGIYIALVTWSFILYVLTFGILWVFAIALSPLAM